jgi:hypothetical protein
MLTSTFPGVNGSPAWAGSAAAAAPSAARTTARNDPLRLPIRVPPSLWRTGYAPAPR